MFVRIVKMTFSPENIDAFLTNFATVKDKIRAFPGNNHVELWQDKSNPNIFFTYSIWNSPVDLENYRNSELFKQVWGFAKPLFSEKAEAWSVDRHTVLP